MKILANQKFRVKSFSPLKDALSITLNDLKDILKNDNHPGRKLVSHYQLAELLKLRQRLSRLDKKLEEFRLKD